jgi:hypothetical protein
VDDGLIDLEGLERNASGLHREFNAAQPFPHLVVDNLLNLCPSAADAFPEIEWGGWNDLGGRYQRNKRTCADIQLIPEPFKELIRALSEPRFLKVLEQITGISELLPDPYLAGGGLHISGPGGILSPHTDFHFYRGLSLYRRVNVIVYLTEDWSAEDGGCLSLFDREDRPVQTVVPDWGRTVIFRTDDQSIHGFPVPVADGKWRRSVALYYYTATPTEGFSGDETTYWREHGVHVGAANNVRFVAYRLLLNLSRAISKLASLVNPNQGLGVVKTKLSNRRRTK